MTEDFIITPDYKKIFSYHDSIADRIKSRENSQLEFKESFNWNSKEEYAKTMAAFANNRGGYIVFGIKDHPRDLIGLKNNNFEITDEAKISLYLNSIFLPEIIFEKFVMSENSKIIGVLRIEEAKNKPIVCIRAGDAIKEADIYYRYNGSSSKIKYGELKMLLEIIRNEERKIWMRHLEKISKVGAENAVILDITDNKLEGKGGSLLIDNKLITKLKFIKEGSFKEGGEPVLKLVGDVKPIIISKSGKIKKNGIQITDDPNAPAIRIEEEEILKAKFPLDYETLIKNFKIKFPNIKLNKDFHERRKKLMENKNLSKRRFLDPNNPKSPKKDFYSHNFLREFEKILLGKKLED